MAPLDLVFFGTLLVLWVWQELGNQVEFRTIPYSEFRTYLAQGIVAEAVVKQDEIDGRIVPKKEAETKEKPTESASPSASPPRPDRRLKLRVVRQRPAKNLFSFGPNGSRIPIS